MRMMLLAAKDLCAERGVAVFPGCSTEQMLCLARELGTPSGDVRDGRLLRAISPQKSAEAPRNTLSSLYGLGAFPFHTETAYWRRPARYLMLRCRNPGEGARETFAYDLLDWSFSHREVLKLRRALWKVDGPHVFLSAILESHGAHELFRYDMNCMRATTAACFEVDEIIRSRISKGSPIRISWEMDLLVVLNNWRCIHARGPSQAPDMNRVLERVLVRESK
jgi:L-asparagine oxygenase